MAKGPQRFTDPEGHALRKLTLWTSGRQSDISASPTLTGVAAGILIKDDQGLLFGTDSDAKIEYDEDGTDQIRVTGADWLWVDASCIYADNEAVKLGSGSDLSLSHNATNSLITNVTGNLIIDNQAATGTILLDCGTDTSATGVYIRNNSGSTMFSAKADGTIAIGGSTSAAIDVVGKLNATYSGTGTGLVREQYGTSATEGWQKVVFEDTISPAAVETAVLTVPAGSIVDGVWANVETALTGGGTTATWSLGISGGDLDGFGTATSDGYTTAGDSLAQNSKFTYLAGATPLTNAGALIGLFSAAAQAIVLTGTQTGGTAAGDTALTVGSIRIRVEYRTALKLDNA